MSGRSILPLFNARGSGAGGGGKSLFRGSINEKTLITILLGSSVFTLIIIFKNLPPNMVNEAQIKKIFIPELNNLPPKSGGGGGGVGYDNSRQIQHDSKEEKPNKQHEQVAQPIVDNVDDPVIRMKRDKVRNMTLFAWNSYKKYAWGKNELKPLSKTGHSPGIFGSGHDLGASIVDALDTLYLMGLHDEFKEGTEWVKDNFQIMINAELSFFEVNIRFIGGFLAAYTLSNDKMFLQKAIEVADAFMPAFSTATGYSFALINPVTKSCKNYNWAASQCSILSEFGTLSLEFQYLSDLTGNKTYQEKIEKIYQSLEKANKKEDLYYNYANPHTGAWCNSQASLAGLGDSFYEYLIKYWLYLDRADARTLDMYLKTMKAVRAKMVVNSGGYTFLGEYSGGGVQQKMGHLACFAGGMFALTGMQDTQYVPENEEYRRLAAEITRSCHESYIRTPSRIGPESFSFAGGREFEPMDPYYILRPETIESYFYLWRTTKDEKYREWAWDAVEAIEKHCRTDGGYTGFRDVRSPESTQDDVQQSFFFAETLKYLYLIFSDDSVLPLDKYVFNTEAHPFLMRNQKK